MITGDLFFNVAIFFQEASKFAAALEIFNKALAFYTNSSQSLDVAKVEL